MAWLEGWGKRFPISVYNSGSAGPYDVTTTIPASLDDFWDTIDSSGNEIRVTRADGVTAATYQWDSFTLSTRTGTLSVNATTLGAANVTVLWVYYDNAGAASGAGSFTPAAAKTPVIAQAPAGGLVLVARPELPGATAPAQRVSKSTGAGVFLWWELVDLLPPIGRKAWDAPRLEEPAYLTWTIEQAGSPVGAMLSASTTHLVEVDGKTYVAVYAQAGTTANDYTGILTVSTVLPGTSHTVHRVIEARCLIQVLDPDET